MFNLWYYCWFGIAIALDVLIFVDMLKVIYITLSIYQDTRSVIYECEILYIVRFHIQGLDIWSFMAINVDEVMYLALDQNCIVSSGIEQK